MLYRKRIVLCAAIILALVVTQAISEAANFVSPEQVYLAKLLAPPPSDKSAQTQAEIVEVIQIQKASTPQENSLAIADGRISVFQFASPILGPKFTSANAPLTEELFRRLAKDAISIFNDPKEKWNRSRPFVVNSDVKACSEHASSGAYPSGHSISGYLTAIILADMIPEMRAEFFERAAQYARNRLVCGVHYRSGADRGHGHCRICHAESAVPERLCRSTEGGAKGPRTSLKS